MSNYHDKEPADFSELVSWACWQVIEGMTQGESLRAVLFGVLTYARGWQPAKPSPSQEVSR